MVCYYHKTTFIDNVTTGKIARIKIASPRVQKPEGTVTKNTYINVSLDTSFHKDVEDGRWHSYSDHQRLVQK
jgi:hypothetical protein